MKVTRYGKRYYMCCVAVLLAVFCLVVALPAGCGSGEQPPPEGGMEGEMALSISSTAFLEEDSIPSKYTCEGQDISPPLAWGEPPEGTQSFALIVDDPDAPGGMFTHWVIFNVPSDYRELPEAVPTQDRLSSGALQGKNDFGRIGYGGPCPPPGHPHRYRFTLYALDQSLDLKAGISKKRQVLNAMQGRILAQGQLTGIYER
jgi:Raf kinase inhibitor-like YbhB/YbcL family protein